MGTGREDLPVLWEEGIGSLGIFMCTLSEFHICQPCLIVPVPPGMLVLDCG